MSLESYLKYLKEKTSEHNVKLILKNQRYFIDGGTTIGGYFCEEPLELAVATKKSKKIWLPYLIHEDSHLDQWIEQCPEYTNTQLEKGICASELIPSWVEGKDYSIEIIERAITSLREMELDCERRTLKKINQFELLIDPLHYIQAAAINIHQYNYILLRRKYLRDGNNLPYEDPILRSKMPTTLRGNFRRLTKKQLEAFDEFQN